MEYTIVNKKGVVHTFVVDDDQLNILCSMHLRVGNKSGKLYVQGHFDGEPSSKPFYLHRIIAKAGQGESVDHINGNTLDNRRANLRLCTQQQNLFNKTGRVKATSKYKGVSWIEREKRWRVSINKDGKTVFRKHFTDEKQAALEYNRVALELFGEFAFLNKVS